MGERLRPRVARPPASVSSIPVLRFSIRARPGPLSALPGQLANAPTIGSPEIDPLVGLHIQEYPTNWVVAIEQTHPDRDAHAVAHREMVATWCLSSAVVGAAFGVAMTKKRDGALLGAGVGLLAAAFVPRQSDQ